VLTQPRRSIAVSKGVQLNVKKLFCSESSQESCVTITVEYKKNCMIIIVFKSRINNEIQANMHYIPVPSEPQSDNGKHMRSNRTTFKHIQLRTK
jgi:hypothetical protein